MCVTVGCLSYSQRRRKKNSGAPGSRDKVYTPVIYIGKTKTYSYLRIHMQKPKPLPNCFHISNYFHISSNIDLLSTTTKRQSRQQMYTLSTYIYIYSKLFDSKIFVAVVVLSYLRRSFFFLYPPPKITQNKSVKITPKCMSILQFNLFQIYSQISFKLLLKSSCCQLRQNDNHVSFL